MASQTFNFCVATGLFRFYELICYRKTGNSKSHCRLQTGTTALIKIHLYLPTYIEYREKRQQILFCRLAVISY